MGIELYKKFVIFRMQGFFETQIEFLKGVGPKRAKLLNDELGIYTYGDLIKYFPLRYEDKTKFHKISQIASTQGQIQIKGRLKSKAELGEKRKKRLVVTLADETGELELIWFRGVTWMSKMLKVGVPYIVFGRPSLFNNTYNMSHPEIELLTKTNEKGTGAFHPIYPSTERLKKGYVDAKALATYQKQLLSLAFNEINESLPSYLLDKYKLIEKPLALLNIHFPQNELLLKKARSRLKFEELFFIQLKILSKKSIRKETFEGIKMADTVLLKTFYENHLPFDLTGAQKRVIKEIYSDMKSGKQMNRLLQGDVGSGKTITAFICILIAVSCNTQSALMAPTEILANQHYEGLKIFANKMSLRIEIITGSTKKKARREILQALEDGIVHLIVGTHALLEESVKFKKLGLAVIDEQHRFGVAQRSKLWQKNKDVYPHVLVMTATPIPRTLAMTVYGDLDVSVIDELPKGRKPIETKHLRDSGRLKLFGFMKKQIEIGRQVYIVYPLIEESVNFDYKDLMDGYESISRAFPRTPLSIVHGRMKSVDKDFEMDRFTKGETKILVATTVIEVGVNVPNATVMVVENAERFGLSQLHQLRGRVGRGADQSYCVLMTGNKMSKEAKERIKTMVETNDGFRIAETDLKIRGPGDMMGTQQSGVLDLNIADLATDSKILAEARLCAEAIINEDPDLLKPENSLLKAVKDSISKNTNWSLIS